MLILFDIDGTLLLSQRAGLKAMAEAGRRLIGPHFTVDGVDFAGRIDPQIWLAAAAANGVDDPAERHDDFRAAYAKILERRLAEHNTVTTLAGVETLVARLEETKGMTLGLLTGNYPETGRLKLAAAGLDAARFPVQAWGSDGRQRRDLPPVAIRRFREHAEREIDPDQVVVIGDTPHDIDCARANGCRAVAVATGPAHSIDDLRACEPDLTVADLADTATLVGWMLAARRPNGARARG